MNRDAPASCRTPTPAPNRHPRLNIPGPRNRGGDGRVSGARSRGTRECSRLSEWSAVEDRVADREPDRRRGAGRSLVRAAYDHCAGVVGGHGGPRPPHWRHGKRHARDRVRHRRRRIHRHRTGQGRVSPIHVDDCARALVHLAEHGEPGGRYFLVNSDPIRLHEFASAFARLAQRPSACCGCPPPRRDW